MVEKCRSPILKSSQKYLKTGLGPPSTVIHCHSHTFSFHVALFFSLIHSFTRPFELLLSSNHRWFIPFRSHIFYWYLYKRQILWWLITVVSLSIWSKLTMRNGIKSHILHSDPIDIAVDTHTHYFHPSIAFHAHAHTSANTCTDLIDSHRLKARWSLNKSNHTNVRRASEREQATVNS